MGTATSGKTTPESILDERLMEVKSRAEHRKDRDVIGRKVLLDLVEEVELEEKICARHFQNEMSMLRRTDEELRFLLNEGVSAHSDHEEISRLAMGGRAR